MPVVAEPDAVKDKRVEPVYDAPEGVGGQDSAPERGAAVDVAHQQAEQDPEDHESGNLLRVEARSSRTVAVVDKTEGPAALDDGRGIVEDALDGIPGYQEHEQREEHARDEGFDEEDHRPRISAKILSFPPRTLKTRCRFLLRRCREMKI